jgi:FlaA1/EpsC-like NDP-sugar epimerase
MRDDQAPSVLQGIGPGQLVRGCQLLDRDPVGAAILASGSAARNTWMTGDADVAGGGACVLGGFPGGGSCARNRSHAAKLELRQYPDWRATSTALGRAAAWQRWPGCWKVKCERGSPTRPRKGQAGTSGGLSSPGVTPLMIDGDVRALLSQPPFRLRRPCVQPAYARPARRHRDPAAGADAHRLIRNRHGPWSIGTRHPVPIAVVSVVWAVPRRRMAHHRRNGRGNRPGAIVPSSRPDSCRSLRVRASSTASGNPLAVRRSIRPSLRFSRDRAGSRENSAPSDADWSPRRTVFGVARGVRGRYLLAIDLVGIVVASYVALALRFDRISGPVMVPAFPLIVVLLLTVRTSVNVQLGLYARRWRYASIPELERIVGAVALGSLVSIVVFYGTSMLGNGWWAEGFPRSFWPIELLLSIAILGGVRFGIRVAADGVPSLARATTADRRATLLYGAGNAGVLMARSAQRHPGSGVRPVGFLDDDPGLAGGIVAGLRVFGGLESIERAVAATGAQTLLITMPSAPGTAVRRVFEAALALHLDVRTVPSVTDLLDGSVDASRIRRVRVEDLLRRPIITEHAAGVEEIIRDRTVVVTGGGGSIGSELARQVFSLGPRRLVLVDRAESPLYLTERELETRRSRGQGSGELRAHLANVASRPAMERLIATEAPDVIIHAAAYKHVPMMEEHPSDAVHVNMGGTLVLLDTAAAAGVERFVFVSTDKAVRPSSVMGASKRVAEMLVADAARRTGRAYVSVRFGNVLGSTGSVVPIFQQQLEDGEPLTITHPDMTRFFMTIPEAAWLILDAAALGRDGDLFVLDMGEPVRILDLARDLIRLAGRDPESQPIVTVGLRPGEKLHEQLFYDREQVEPTASAKVLRALAPPPPLDVRDHVRQFLAMANGENEAALRDALLDYVRDADDVAPAAEAADTAYAGKRIAIDIAPSPRAGVAGPAGAAAR